jgi:hypothetical protein
MTAAATPADPGDPNEQWAAAEPHPTALAATVPSDATESTKIQ